MACRSSPNYQRHDCSSIKKSKIWRNHIVTRFSWFWKKKIPQTLRSDNPKKKNELWVKEIEKIGEDVYKFEE